jgi:hypothetical protein
MTIKNDSNRIKALVVATNNVEGTHGMIVTTKRMWRKI